MTPLEALYVALGAFLVVSLLFSALRRIDRRLNRRDAEAYRRIVDRRFPK